MVQPYRIAATPQPDEPDLADTYEALLRARAVRSRRLVTAICSVVAGFLVLALVEKPRRDSVRSPQDELESRAAEKIANAREAIQNAETLARNEQATFSRVVGAVLDGADDHEEDQAAAPERGRAAAGEPARKMSTERGRAAAGEPARKMSTERCNVVLPTRERSSLGKRSLPLLVVAKDDRDLPSPSIAILLADIRRAQEHLGAGRTMEAILYGNALETQRLHYDVIVATTKMNHPVVSSPTSYEPGEITGRAYLYDFTRHRVVCAGNVHAMSSRNIEYAYSLTATSAAAKDFSPLLEDDLNIQLEHAIADGVLFKID